MRKFDVLIVGAGPAGLAAAAEAAAAGYSVGLLDDNPTLGGQIWRGADPAGASWYTKVLHARPIQIMHRARVVAAADHTLLVETPDQAEGVGYQRLILACGAREQFLPFPGWTLPNVLGAGGLQALVKGGLPIVGKRVVVAGSGPLLLAVAALLRRKGADVRLIAEQTSWRKLAHFAAHIGRDPRKLIQALRLGIERRGVPFKANCWVTAAHGADTLASVTLRSGSRFWNEECDYLACGFGLLPNLELAQMLGCRTTPEGVWVDRTQHTSVPDVYACGELTGIGGLEKALIEGRIAGMHAANRAVESLPLLAQCQAARDFTKLLATAFALRPELAQLADATTIVCRCEDVRYGALCLHRSWRSAKLHTRCGMGACQGRICGGITGSLFGWSQDSVRPPLSPARLDTLIVDITENTKL